MVKSLGAAHKTVVLLLAGNGGMAADRLAAPLRDTATFIAYKKSWRRAWPRLFLGLPASMFPASYICAILSGLWLGSLMFLAENGVPIRNELFGFLLEAKGFLVLVGLTSLWVYLVLFFRPAIDEQAGVQLAKRLRSNRGAQTKVDEQK